MFPSDMNFVRGFGVAPSLWLHTRAIGGGGGFFVASDDFGGRLFEHSFPACTF